MSPKNLAIVLLKCFGIWIIVAGLGLLVAGLQSLQLSADSSTGFNPRQIFLLQGGEGLIYLALGILFLVNTEAVTRVLFRSLEEPALPAPSPFSYQAIGFSLLGAWALSSAIPTLISRGLILLILYDPTSQAQRAYWWTNNWGQLLGAAVEAVIGSILFFGSRWLASLWFRMQPIRYAKKISERPAS